MAAEKRRILLTAAGTATALNVLSSLRRSTLFDVTTIAVDADPEAVGLQLADSARVVPRSSEPTYLDVIEKLCVSEQVDFLFPLHSSEILLFARNRKRFLDKGINMTLAEPDVVEICTNKQLFAQFLTRHGLPAPLTYSTGTRPKFPAFVKPFQGSSSSNTHLVRDEAELIFVLQRHPSSLVQEYVQWPELTVDCFVSRGGELIGCVARRRMKIREGKSVVSETLEAPEVVRAVERLLGLLEYRGPCNVQLFFSPPDHIKFVELNPRLAAGGLPLASEAGVNIPELMLREAGGEVLSERLSVESGVRMYRYLTEIFVRAHA